MNIGSSGALFGAFSHFVTPQALQDNTNILMYLYILGQKYLFHQLVRLICAKVRIIVVHFHDEYSKLQWYNRTTSCRQYVTFNSQLVR